MRDRKFKILVNNGDDKCRIISDVEMIDVYDKYIMNLQVIEVVICKKKSK